MTPHLREGTNDAEIWQSVYTDNEYQAPDSMDGMVVLDIGGHIGSFARLCLDRGANKVFSVEPASANIEMFRKNVPECEEAGGRSTLLQFAVGKVGGKQKLVQGPIPNSHSGYTLTLHGGGGEEAMVDTVTFTELMDGHVKLRSLDWCKLDAEGAEYYVFAAYDQAIRRIKRYTVEFHGPPDRFSHVASRIRSLGYRMRWSKQNATDPNLTVADFSL